MTRMGTTISEKPNPVRPFTMPATKTARNPSRYVPNDSSKSPPYGSVRSSRQAKPRSLRCSRSGLMTAYRLLVVYSNEMHYPRRTTVMIAVAPKLAKNIMIDTIVEVYA